jgi:transposase
VDFSGNKPHLVDRRTGELIPVELFVGVLGASSYTYAVATRSQRLQDWVRVHIGMAEYFSGSSEIWVPDNLKSGVTKPCSYEPVLNRSYQELAEHYGAVVIPARSGKAKDKAKVEVGVQVAQRWILATLRNRTFFELAELNEAIRQQLEVLNDRPMKHLGVSRRELFERLDRPVLKPLPSRPYELAEWKRCGVNIDYHIDVERNYYSVPYQLVGEKVEARFTSTTVEVYFKNRRVASHQRLWGRGRHQTLSQHMPHSHREHAKWTPSRLIRWAERSGPSTGKLVSEILVRRSHPEQGYRACLGIMRLGRKHGLQRLEAACSRALFLRSYRYLTVKNILSSGQDRLPLEENLPSLPPTPDHDNIRGAEYYAALQEGEC